MNKTSKFLDNLLSQIEVEVGEVIKILSSDDLWYPYNSRSTSTKVEHRCMILKNMATLLWLGYADGFSMPFSIQEYEHDYVRTFKETEKHAKDLVKVRKDRRIAFEIKFEIWSSVNEVAILLLLPLYSALANENEGPWVLGKIPFESLDLARDWKIAADTEATLELYKRYRETLDILSHPPSKNYLVRRAQLMAFQHQVKDLSLKELADLLHRETDQTTIIAKELRKRFDNLDGSKIQK